METRATLQSSHAERNLAWADVAEDSAMAGDGPLFKALGSSVPALQLPEAATDMADELYTSVMNADNELQRVHREREPCITAVHHLVEILSGVVLGEAPPQIRFFGSTHYNMSTADSDMDIIVTLPPGTNLLGFLTDCCRELKSIASGDPTPRAVAVPGDFSRCITAVNATPIKWKKTFTFKLGGITVDMTAQHTHIKDGVQQDNSAVVMSSTMKRLVDYTVVEAGGPQMMHVYCS